jgi:hypothetical protein
MVSSLDGKSKDAIVVEDMDGEIGVLDAMDAMLIDDDEIEADAYTFYMPCPISCSLTQCHCHVLISHQGTSPLFKMMSRKAPKPYLMPPNQSGH